MALTDAQLTWLGNDNVRVVLVEAAYNAGVIEIFCNNNNTDPNLPDIFCNNVALVPEVRCNTTAYETTKEAIFLSNTPYITKAIPFEDVAGNTGLTHISYDDALDSIPSISSRIDSSASLGNINFINANGDYDFMFNADIDSGYAFEGQKIKVLLGDRSWDRANFIPAFDGLIDSVLSPDKNKIAISIRNNKDIFDKTNNSRAITNAIVSRIVNAATKFILDVEFVPITGDPLASIAYDPSSSSIPEGVINTRVPICLGECFNVEPVLIDAYNHVYMIHDGPITSVSSVKSNGVELNITPPPVPNPEGLPEVQYEVDEAIGCIRLLDHPRSSKITVDVIGDPDRGNGFDAVATLTDHSVPWLVEWLVLEFTSLTKDDIDYDSFEAIDLANDSTVGLFFKGEETISTLLTAVTSSIGSYYIFDRANMLQLTILEDPSTLPVPNTVIGPDEIIRNGISIQGIDPPKSQLTLSYAKNWTIMSKEEQAGILDEVDGLQTQQVLASEYQTLVKYNGSVKIKFPLAETQDTIETLLNHELDAQAEIDRRAAIRAIKRYTYRLNSIIPPLDLSVGDTVVIKSNRFGLDTGETGVILSMSEKLTSNRVDLEVWK